RGPRARAGGLGGLEPWRPTVGDEEATDWKAVGEALGEHHRGGADLELLVGEERPGPSHSGLHLVEDEQRAELVGDASCGHEKIGLGDVDSALALNRFEHDATPVGA